MPATEHLFTCKGNYIHGSFIRPSQAEQWLQPVNPRDVSQRASRFPVSLAAVSEAFESSRQAFPDWSSEGINARVQALRRFIQVLIRMRQPLVSTLSRETGCLLREAEEELSETLEDLSALIEQGLDIMAPRLDTQRGGRCDRKALGSIALICPWSLPLRTAALRSAAVLLCGNTVVYKPSQLTPGVGQLLAEAWDRCQLPRGCFNMVQGSGSTLGRHLIMHPRLQGLAFIGAFPTAQRIRRRLLERPEVRATYATGGKSLALVLEDSDLDLAARELIRSMICFAGQRPEAVGRVIAHRRIIKPLLHSLQQTLSVMELDREIPFSLGPVISENMVKRVEKYQRGLRSHGHECLLEAQHRGDLPGFHVSPGVWKVRWQDSRPFLYEEPPGPLLLIYEVESDEVAVRLHNQASYRLSCSLFSRRPQAELLQLAGRLRTGGLFLNRAPHRPSPYIPVGGWGLAQGASFLDFFRALSTTCAVYGLQREPSVAEEADTVADPSYIDLDEPDDS